ncbi:MAG TPA: carbohydrate porin, partial [Gammaproteobacteria bacterium]|nr:carbohydrate porin [Gammaproteobacteria bacterium]
PGNIGVGGWHQTGLILNGPLSEHGANGYYLFASQRLWYRHPMVDASGISGFLQYGKNDSTVLAMTKFLGGGLTAFGLTPNRPDDSMGVGLAFSWLNQNSFSQRTELLCQAYYQAKIATGLYLEPVLSYIPTPGALPNLDPSWAGTLRAIVLF